MLNRLERSTSHTDCLHGGVAGCSEPGVCKTSSRSVNPLCTSLRDRSRHLLHILSVPALLYLILTLDTFNAQSFTANKASSYLENERIFNLPYQISAGWVLCVFVHKGRKVSLQGLGMIHFTAYQQTGGL